MPNFCYSTGFSYDPYLCLIFATPQVFVMIPIDPLKLLSKSNKTKKVFLLRKTFLNIGGLDGTRTRDPMRDRHVF